MWLLFQQLQMPEKVLAMMHFVKMILSRLSTCDREGIEVKCNEEDLNAKLYNNRASAHYHLGKASFVLTLRIVTKLHLFILFQHSLVFFCIPWLSTFSYRHFSLLLVLLMLSRWSGSWLLHIKRVTVGVLVKKLNPVRLPKWTVPRVIFACSEIVEVLISENHLSIWLDSFNLCINLPFRQFTLC